MNALVLAGGGRDEVCEGTGAINKAFVTVGGTAMVTRVLQVLRSDGRVERIVVVAPSPALDDPALGLADERRPSGERIVESIERGVAGFDPEAMLLLATSDAPLIEDTSLNEFAEALSASDADLVYSIAERSAHERRYPGVPHTWARMRDGVYCGGAVFGIRPRVVRALKGFLDDLARARKSPLRLASFFGWDAFLRFALGRLSVADAERRATSILGYPVRAIVAAPDLAFNVDRKGDVALAERFLSR